MSAFNAKLKEIETFLSQNVTPYSPFFLGTANPTQLDIHMYACLSRPYFSKNSVFHDEFYKHMHFEDCGRVVNFIKAMQARPEFSEVLSKEITHHEYLKVVQATTPGIKVPFFLPIAH
jgi:glutathione S-transferase